MRQANISGQSQPAVDAASAVDSWETFSAIALSDRALPEHGGSSPVHNQDTSRGTAARETAVGHPRMATDAPHNDEAQHHCRSCRKEQDSNHGREYWRGRSGGDAGCWFICLISSTRGPVMIAQDAAR